MDSERALVSLGIAVNGSQVFSAFNPSIFTIRHFGAEPNTVRDIRQGELIASAMVITLGLIVSGMMDDSHPFVFSVLVAGTMVGVYEWALRTRERKVEDAAEGSSNEEVAG